MMSTCIPSAPTRRSPALTITLSTLAALGAALPAQAQVGEQTQAQAQPQPQPTPMPAAPTLAGWQFGAVIDIAQMSQALPLGLRSEGLGLGHSDLLARGSLGRHLSAEAVAVVSTHEGEFERGIEKLFVQTRTLPAGLQARAGRFASQVGYLNEQHPHADDFAERPPLYRAFLGHHYFDDGLRLNWTAPTPFFLQLGAEAFSGRKLSPEGVRRSRAGVTTITGKVGTDIGLNQAWQAGWSVLVNRRAAPEPDDHAGEIGAGLSDHAADASADAHGMDEHAHGHGARFQGRRLTMFDLAWKWAPNGNARQQQVRVVFEQARLAGLQEPSLAARRHEATSLSVVWRFRPDWEMGLRGDRLRAAIGHEDHADPVRLDEQSLMVAYKPSHRQTLRVQWVGHRNTQGLELPGRRTLALQLVVAFGAHGAHNF